MFLWLLCSKSGKKQAREAALGTAGSQPSTPEDAASPLSGFTNPAANGADEQRKTEANGQAAPPSLVMMEPAGSAAADAAAALLALVLLLFSHRAAVHVLAPQTGAWLAGSFCSLLLYALAAVGVVAGHVGEEGSATLAGLRAGSADAPSGSGMHAARLGVAACSYWAAAAAAVPLAVPAAARLAGRLVLAPGLADDASLRISDGELTLRAMALAGLLAGPLAVCLGSAAGAAGGRALRRWAGPDARPQLLLLPLVAAAAAAGLGLGLPAALLPPRPASSLPPAVAGAALLAAAALTPDAAAPGAATAGAAAAPARRRKQRRPPGDSGRRWRRWLAAVLAAASLAVAAHRARTPQCGGAPSGPPVPLAGGLYSVVMQCETAAGSRLGIIEGTYQGRYRCVRYVWWWSWWGVCGRGLPLGHARRGGCSAGAGFCAGRPRTALPGSSQSR